VSTRPLPATRRFKHLFITAIAVFALFFVPGCGGDDESSNPATTQTTPAPTQTGTQGGGKEAGGQSDSSKSGDKSSPSSPEDRRTGADLRGQLSQGEGAGVVTGVDLGRTTITVHTRLPRSDAETGSSLCAAVRRFIAQRPSRSTVGRVVIAGRNGVTVTAC
jgi:hypothetical protein